MLQATEEVVEQPFAQGTIRYLQRLNAQHTQEFGQDGKSAWPYLCPTFGQALQGYLVDRLERQQALDQLVDDARRHCRFGNPEFLCNQLGRQNRAGRADRLDLARIAKKRFDGAKFETRRHACRFESLSTQLAVAKKRSVIDTQPMFRLSSALGCDP